MSDRERCIAGRAVARYAWDHDVLVLAIPWFMIVAYAARPRPLSPRALTIITLVVAPLTWVLCTVPSPQVNAGRPAAG